MKPLFLSKIVIAQIIGGVAMYGTATGQPWAPLLADPQTQTLAIGLVTNAITIVLRKFTHQPVKVL